mgnify:CR=1 FL=1
MNPVFSTIFWQEKRFKSKKYLETPKKKQHKKLVNYYARSGFKIIKYVGDDFRDIPARMVWGGCGTLMRADIDEVLQSWTVILEKSEVKSHS